MDLTPLPSEHQPPALPVAASPTSIQAYQRAPTLMAGISAGAQGKVQVWMPSRRRLWGWTLGAGAVTLIFVWLMVRQWRHGLPFDLESAFFLLCPAIDVTWLVMRLLRPCYVTTDDAGIAITTWKGARALQWSEVRSIKRGDNSLAIGSSKTVSIHLIGYSKVDCKRLLELIVEKAALLPHPRKKQVFLCPAYLKNVPAQLGPWN